MIVQRKYLWIVIMICICSVFIVIISFNNFKCFLSRSNKVPANILIVEGWLPEKGIEMAYNEFIDNNYDLLLTASILSRDLDFFNMSRNGFLIFYPRLKTTPPNDSASHQIEIVAHSKMDEKYLSHFNVYINDSLLAEFTADKTVRNYSLSWTGSLKDIDSILVHFDNDYVDEGGDRNLYVREIIFDDTIVVSYKNNSVYDIGKIDNKERTPNDYHSHAELARIELISKGIDPSSIVAVTGRRSEINRTLASALAVRKWFKSNKGKINGINVISMGIHSRRTWITYRNVIGQPAVTVGIISLPENIDQRFEELKPVDILTEMISLIYYRIILLPFYFIS